MPSPGRAGKGQDLGDSQWRRTGSRDGLENGHQAEESGGMWVGIGVGLSRRPVGREQYPRLPFHSLLRPRLPGRHHPPPGRADGPPPPGRPIRRTPSLMGEAVRAEGSQGLTGGAPPDLPRTRRPTAHRPPPSLISTDACRPPLGFRWLQNLKVKS